MWSHTRALQWIPTPAPHENHERSPYLRLQPQSWPLNSAQERSLLRSISNPSPYLIPNKNSLLGLQTKPFNSQSWQANTPAYTLASQGPSTMLHVPWHIAASCTDLWTCISTQDGVSSAISAEQTNSRGDTVMGPLVQSCSPGDGTEIWNWGLLYWSASLFPLCVHSRCPPKSLGGPLTLTQRAVRGSLLET